MIPDGLTADQKKDIKELGYTLTSPELLHIDIETFGADASTEIAEELDTPGYADRYNTGMMISRALIMPGKASKLGVGGAASGDVFLRSQIVVGEKPGTPALLDLTDDKIVMDACRQPVFNTNGGRVLDWPLPLVNIRPLPFIVMPKYYIMHGSANNASFNSKEVTTLLYYHTCIVSDELYNTLWRQQSKTS